MFFSKLRPNDSFGLVVFDNKAETMIPCEKRSEQNPENVFKLLDAIQERGGTTLSTGFDLSRKDLV